MDQGGCEPLLIAHAKRNMNLGNDREFLIWVISQCLPYMGYPRLFECFELHSKGDGDIMDSVEGTYIAAFKMAAVLRAHGKKTGDGGALWTFVFCAIS